MTNPTDKLRAIVEEASETVCIKCGQRVGDIPKFKYCGDGSDKDNGHRYAKLRRSKKEHILAKLVLAVLEECDAIGGNIGSIRGIINTHMQEMGE
jgi:hypothetical protein